jgi:hypothetical protein
LSSWSGQRRQEPPGERHGERNLERGQPVGQPAGSGVEVERRDRQVMAPRDGQRLVEPVVPDPELRRPVARVLSFSL